MQKGVSKKMAGTFFAIPLGFINTHRELTAEAKTMLVALAQGLTSCGWRPFNTKGCCTTDIATQMSAL